MSTMPQETAKPLRPAGIFWGYLLAAICGALAVIAVLFLLAVHLIDLSFLSDAACRKVEATRYFSKFTYCFYGSDWNEEVYLSAISGFYSTLVAILVAVQALISWLAFTVIRSSNKQAIGEEVEREVPYFFKSKDADRLLRDVLQETSHQAAKSALTEIRKDEDKSTEELQRAVYNDLQPALEGVRGEIEELRVKFESYINGDDDDAAEREGKISE